MGEDRDTEEADPDVIDETDIDSGSTDQRQCHEVDDEEDCDRPNQRLLYQAAKQHAVDRDEKEQYQSCRCVRVALDLGRSRRAEKQRLSNRLEYVVAEQQQERVAKEQHHALALSGTQPGADSK